MTTDTTRTGLDVLHPGHPGFAEAVTTAAGVGSPALVVRPRTAREVAAAVQLARRRGLPLTVRAGGHSTAGLTTASEGLLLDLRAMDGVEVDPATRLVRVGGGAHWGGVARALQPYGLALTSGDTSTVGVGGLTLGGGIGWLVRRYGLTVDSLVGAELVTADGRVREVSADAHPDLFWGLRGGGGNLGVVTRFDFTAQEVADVVFGTVVLALEDPLTLLTRWRDLQQEADERLTTALTLFPAMGDQPATAMLALCFDGSLAQASHLLAELRGLGTVLSDDVTERPYAEVLEEAEHPPGMRVALDNVFLPELGAPVLADLVDVHTTGPTMVSVRALGGAFSRVPADATALAHRSAQALAFAVRMTPDPAAAAPEIPRWHAVARHGTGSYVNFLSFAGEDAVSACYPAATRHRLASLKAEYDPDNVFHRTVNVRPEGSAG